MQVFAHDELKCADEGSFKRGDIHFAVTLASVAVAHLKERAWRVYRKIKRRAGDEILVIEIAAHNPRWSAVETSRAFRRCIAHASEKRMQRNFDARGEL